MKCRLLALILALILLCGCQEVLQDPSVKQSTHTSVTIAPEFSDAEEPTELVPIYDPTPDFAETGITVDGRELTVRYLADDVLMLRLQELTELLQITLTPAEQLEPGVYTCEIKGDDWSVSISNNQTAFTINGAKKEFPCKPRYDGSDWFAPAGTLLQALGYTEYADTEQDRLYYTMLPDVSKIPEGIEIPVMMYHAVSDNCWGEADLFVSPGELEKQLQYLLDNGYTPIWFEDLPNVADIEKPILLTFDDGYDDNYTELYPILQKYQVKATIFVIAGDLAQHHKMTAEQVTELATSGLVSIQSHTMTHPDLNTVWGDELQYQLGQSQLELTRMTGKQPFVLCYPTGFYSDESLEVTRQYYQFGLLMSSGRYTTGDDRYLIPRYYVSRYTGLDAFADMIS